MRGSQAKAPRGPSAERMVGPRVGAGAPRQQVMERMESGNQPWTVRAAGEPGPPGPQGVQEGAWPDPRGRAAVVAEGQGCPGRAAASVPWPGKPRNQAVSLTSSCSLRRLPIGQTCREARLRVTLEEATWVRGQGPEGDGRAREWGGCQVAGSPGPAPQPLAGSLTRHVQSPCERNHKTLLRGMKKTQNRKVRTFQHHQDVSSL